MDITEIIEKVKQNLLTQKNLKEEMENADQKREILTEKIDYHNEQLLVATEDEKTLKVDLIAGLQETANSLKDTLSLYMALTTDGDSAGYGVFANFMGKNNGLLASDYTLMSAKNPRNLKVADFVDVLFNDYLTKGDVIFDKDTIAKLKEIQKIYQIKPEVIIDKLVAMNYDKKVSKLAHKLTCAKTELAESVAEFKDIEEQIAKTKEFKSEFMKKIFTKKARLESRRAGLLIANENLNKFVKDLENQLADRATLKAESTEYVKNELAALDSVLNWVAAFETAKKDLVKYKKEHIDVLVEKIQDLEENLADTNTRMKEVKGLLQLNKKVNNETVLNALMNKSIIEQLKTLSTKQVAKEDVEAVKFIETKYDNYLQGCVEKLI